MDVEQRVLAVLRGEQPDRVPVLMHFNPYVEDWYTYLPVFADVLPAAERYADVVFDWSFPAPLMFTAAARWIEQHDLGGGQVEQIIHTPDGPLTEVVRTGLREQPPLKRWIQTVDDAERALSMPYVSPKPDLDRFLETTRRLGGRVITRATFRDPIALADWIDDRTFAAWRVERRDLIRRLLDAAFERIADGLRTCLEAGVGPVYVLNRCQPGLLRTLSDKDVEEFVLDYDRRLVEIVHDYPDRYVALGAPNQHASLLESLVAVGMDGLRVVDPPPRGECGLAEMKRLIGDRVCLIATLSAEELSGVQADQIDALVRRTLADGAAGARFMLLPCPLPGARDLNERAADNLIEYLKAAHRLGAYPLQI